ncbi:MAG: dodecin family protein [Anaerolineales bacterium]|jgi:flavin-binding protein dodecin
MSIVKVIEVLAEGKSIEAAMESAVKGASETVREIKSIYLENLQAIVEDGKIVKYRVNAKISFIVGD